MNQQRLNMFTRKKGAEELAHENRIAKIKADIRKQYDIITQKTGQFKQRRKKQKELGLGFGEVEATDQALASALKPNRQKIAGLKRELITLTGQAGTVERCASEQSDLFNS